MGTTKRENEKKPSTFQVELSLLGIVSIFLSCGALSVAGGCIYREYVASLDKSNSTAVGADPEGSVFSRVASQLPRIVLSPSKKMPDSVYSGRRFHEHMSAASDAFVQISQECEMQPDGSCLGSGVNSWKSTADGNQSAGAVNSSIEENEEEHEPAGQHLLVDIEGVSAEFLDSEKQLAEAMITLINQSGLTMLSYHCHGLVPAGVSCVGVLLESHVSFHTWPEEGVITLDLFTCGPNSLMPLIGDIMKLFGVPRPGKTSKDVGSLWSYKKRGFPKKDHAYNPESIEMSQFLQGWMDYDLKEEVINAESPFQTIDIYDVINPRFNTIKQYKDSLSDEDSYFSQNPELFKPDRVVFLDGISQSRSRGEAAYHESLVHPVMIAHENPRRVAIIGGGEGATLREVLKHKTVEKVFMVEIDELMVNVSRNHLSDWSDCSNIAGSAASCFDDDRTETRLTDAIGWFKEHYLDASAVKEEDKFDVIIMDALDPSAVVSFSDVLYGSDEFLASLYNSLREDGVLVSQVGEHHDLQDAAPEMSDVKYTQNLIRSLQREGFKYATEYFDAHGGFMAPWTYIALFKDEKTKKSWYKNQAEVDLTIQRRGMNTIGGSESPFRYFDGATMMPFHYLSRVTEEVMCRNQDNFICDSGHGFDPYVANTPLKDAAVEKQQNGYKALETKVDGIRFPPLSVDIASQLSSARSKAADSASTLSSWMEQAGCTSDLWGGTSVWVPTTGTEALARKAGESCIDLEQRALEKGSFIFQPFVYRNYENMMHQTNQVDSTHSDTS